MKFLPVITRRLLANTFNADKIRKKFMTRCRSMHFRKDLGNGENNKKYSCKTHKEHVRLKILYPGTPAYPFEDFLNNGKIPMYEGYMPTNPDENQSPHLNGDTPDNHGGFKSDTD